MRNAVRTNVELDRQQCELDEIKHCRIAALGHYYPGFALTSGYLCWVEQKCSAEYSEVADMVVALAKLILAERADARMKGMSE